MTCENHFLFFGSIGKLKHSKRPYQPWTKDFTALVTKVAAGHHITFTGSKI